MHAFKVTGLYGGEIAGHCYCQRCAEFPATTVTHLLDPEHGHLSVPVTALQELRTAAGKSVNVPTDLHVHDIILVETPT